MANQETHQELAGVLAIYENSDTLVAGMRRVKESQFENFDAYTPFPIHGLDDVQGIKRSPIPYVSFAAGLTGFLVAFGLQYWTSAVDWPLNVSGKPFNSWPAFVPIMFELTVLFSGLATFAALLFFCKIPNTKSAAFDPSITNNKFAIVIEPSKDKPFNENEAMELLRKTGAKEVRKVYAEGWFT